jgi:RimJ/RimL family protein N-acetyltransferase
MGSTIGVLLDWAAANMNVRHMRTTAIEGNEPSVKVLEKNGFKVEKTLPEFALKMGRKVGLHVLDWKVSP